MAQRKVVPSPAAADALALIGARIRIARHEHRWTAAQLATRIGVSRKTVLALEAGHPGVAVGVVFNAAVEVAVPLFGAGSPGELATERAATERTRCALPSRTYPAPEPRPSTFGGLGPGRGDLFAFAGLARRV